MGHESLAASCMSDALEQLNSLQSIDALFTDIRLLPMERSGFELAQNAVALRPGLRVLYTTGSPVTEAMRALFVDGALFLQKPYSPDQFQISVKELLAAPF
jgi:DNA-binding NtrC family response regulator